MKQSTLFAIYFLIILSLAAFLRFWNLEGNPAWYTDEASHIEIAKNLLDGENRYFAVEDSTLLFARLPLFEVLLAGIFRIWGISYLVLRSLTASLGMIALIILFFCMWDISKNPKIALISAFCFAIMPQIVLYHRFGFSYNLLQVLVLISLWASYYYMQNGKSLYLAIVAFSIGLGAISDVIGWSFIPLIFIVTWSSSGTRKIWGFVIAALPLSIYVVANLLTVPDAFVFDFIYTIGRTGGGNISQQLWRVAENYTIMLSDVWWLLGFMGLIFLKTPKLRLLSFIFLFPLVLVARTVPLYSLSAYYLIPFYPLIAIGLGNFFYFAWAFLWQQVGKNNNHKLNILLLTGLFVIPFMYLTVQKIYEVRTRIPTAIDGFLIDEESANAVIQFLSEANLGEEDIVIASAPIAWGLNNSAADFQMMVIAEGFDAIHLPANLPQDRFVFAPAYQQARFVVIDNLWRNWGLVHIPILSTITNEIEDWDIVLVTGDVKVYENPQK